MNFSDAQLRGLATILADAGQVFLATLVIPFLFRTTDMGGLSAIFGLALALVSWFVSIRLLKEVVSK